MKINKEKVLIGLGVWIFVLPFTGFPESWKTWLIVCTGLIVIYLGALLLKQRTERERAAMQEMKTETFTETIDHD